MDHQQVNGFDELLAEPPERPLELATEPSLADLRDGLRTVLAIGGTAAVVVAGVFVLMLAVAPAQDPGPASAASVKMTPSPTPTPNVPEAGDIVAAGTELPAGQMLYALMDGNNVVIDASAPLPPVVLEDVTVRATAAAATNDSAVRGGFEESIDAATGRHIVLVFALTGYRDPQNNSPLETVWAVGNTTIRGWNAVTQAEAVVKGEVWIASQITPSEHVLIVTRQ